MKTPAKTTAKATAAKATAAKASAAKTAAAAPATAVKAKTTTITFSHLAKDLAEAHNMPKKAAAAVLADLTGMITKNLKKGARVRLNGIGVLQVRKRPARMGRNPATGAAIKIKASKKVAFRAAKELKETI